MSLDGRTEVMAMVPAGRGLQPAVEGYTILAPGETFTTAEDRMFTLAADEITDAINEGAADIRPRVVVAGRR